jgi:hypothetical protein
MAAQNRKNIAQSVACVRVVLKIWLPFAVQAW